ncbi:MAG TPA: tetratricopeptide repeat protein [Myxococcales bacterium]|jgi:tetratricopeptide (TPR) repeat protein
MRLLLAPLALALTVLALAAGTALAAEPAAKASIPAETAEVERLKKELGQIEGRLQLVEQQYTYKNEPGEQEALKRRYSDAEIQFLLNNYQAASVLFYDLVGGATFRGMREYPGALYMLAESLYQQQNYLGARLYFREHMNQRGDRYRDALGRYLEISGRINEFTGIDQYIEQAKGPSGALPAELAYVYAKWLFRRTDLPEKERIARAQAVFGLVADASGAYAMQAAYFLGVLAVQQGDMAAAAAAFERVLKYPANSPREKKTHEQANLSLGRVYFEQGKYTEAIDRYQEIDYNSDNFVDALYEIAWTHVRRAKAGGAAEYEKANQACEKLLLAAPDSVLAPEARILQGHLLLKLGKYQEANESYTAVINTYLEVYDNIDGRLKAHPDPVLYFQQVIAESGKTFDISAFLPPVAVKWATTSRDVADAVRMTGDIDSSKKGVVESNEVAARLLEVLDKRSLEVFPQYQEGLNRADAVESALAQVEKQLLAVEQRLVGGTRLGELQKELEQVKAEREGLDALFQSLPKSEQDLEARKLHMSQEITRLDQEAYRLGLQVQSLYAVLAAVEKYLADTRDQRKPDAQTDKDEIERMKKEREIADGLGEELGLMQKAMRDEKAKMGLTGTADATLRERYEKALQHEKELLARLRTELPDECRTVLKSVDEARATIAALQGRSATAKGTIRDAVRRKADVIREKVRTETDLLKSYDAEVAQVASSAQNLVGSIAFESFKRVRRQFYDLVLKADVGLVDVAWTRKQDKTLQIQNLAKQKDRELKGLDTEFKEVLKDVE